MKMTMGMIDYLKKTGKNTKGLVTYVTAPQTMKYYFKEGFKLIGTIDYRDIEVDGEKFFDFDIENKDIYFDSIAASYVIALDF